MITASSEPANRPASGDRPTFPILQTLKKIIVIFFTLFVVLGCRQTPTPPPAPPPVPRVPTAAESVGMNAAMHRILTANDPLLSAFNVDKVTQWVVNEGPAQKFTPQTGEASYYHEPQKMANGEHFDPDEMTAAHKTLPLHSIVSCTNLENGRSVTVMITDRGPHVDGRILDLSRAAARKLGITRKDGVAHCRVEVLAYPLEELSEAVSR